jgi:hypothetical protein
MLEANMRTFRTILLGGAAAATIMVITGGSANAGDSVSPVVTPVVVYSTTTDIQDDMTGCRSHKEDTKPASVDTILP